MTTICVSSRIKISGMNSVEMFSKTCARAPGGSVKLSTLFIIRQNVFCDLCNSPQHSPNVGARLKIVCIFVGM